MTTRWSLVVQVDYQECNNERDQYLDRLNQSFQDVDRDFVAERGNTTFGNEQKLPAGDYHIVARDNDANRDYILMVIERKTPADLHRSITEKEVRCTGGKLQRTEVQLRQLYYNGVNDKIFLIEGDEDSTTFYGQQWNPWTGQIAKRESKIKCIKTFRCRLAAGGYYPGIRVFQTRNQRDTTGFLIDQLRVLRRKLAENSNALSRAPSFQQVKDNVANAMKNTNFLRYLRLIEQRGIGPHEAMKRLAGSNFRCPSLKYNDAEEHRCRDITHPRHRPNFYVPAATSWHCPACTFDNTDPMQGIMVCAMCRAETIVIDE